MKKLLNTLYITSTDTYLSLDGENIVIRKDDESLKRIPLHNLESIITFGYTGASPALMNKCAEYGINLSFLSSSGKFLARVIGEQNGNVILRKTQYRVSDSEEKSCQIAKNFIIGKVFNTRKVIDRACRDYALRLDIDKLKNVSEMLKDKVYMIARSQSLENLRGLEGEAASTYFSVFDDLILQSKDTFFFKGRNKRPPLDNVNAMLSFAYTLLAHDCAGAAESNGLDSYVGFLHRDRPGRNSLALDLMEELRPVLADRFVLSLVNKKIVNEKDFYQKEDGVVLMTDDARKKFLQKWQERKQEIITHPFLKEKIQWGLVPFVQAMLLARFLRGDLDAYPPFLWK